MITRAAAEGIKLWITLGGAGLAVAWRWLPPQARALCLAVLLALAGANYVRFGEEFFERVDTYDLVHYYLNAKYFEELGYYDLYPACLMADAEAGQRFGNGSQYMAQDETGDHFAPIAQAFERGQVVKASFTPERWQAFSHDFLYLERGTKGLDKSTWRQMIQDHGYNGTTVWTAVARPITRLVPVEYVKLLCWIDVVLLALAVGSAWWAWDRNVAAWVALFLLTTYSTRWPTISWALLRYDYVAALIVATALLHKGRPLAAGILTGYSAVIRVFPMLWLTFPAIEGLIRLAQRKVDRPLLTLAGGFLLGVAVFQGGALLSVGPGALATNAADLMQHTSSEELSSRRIGLALALNYRGQLLPKNITREMKAAIESQRKPRYALAIGTILALGWALRRRTDAEAFAFGFIPFFLLTTASYYYYVTRATLVTVHAANLDRPRHVFGLAALFLMEALSNFAETRYPEHRVFLVGALAWSICAYILVMIAWLLIEDRRAPDA